MRGVRNTYQSQLLAMLGAKEQRTRAAAASRPLAPDATNYALAAGNKILSGIIDEGKKKRYLEQLKVTGENKVALDQRNKAIDDALGYYRAGVQVPPELAQAAGMPHLAQIAPRTRAVDRAHAKQVKIIGTEAYLFDPDAESEKGLVPLGITVPEKEQKSPYIFRATDYGTVIRINKFTGEITELDPEKGQDPQPAQTAPAVQPGGGKPVRKPGPAPLKF
jgi:hypothetical protein